ncbi:MAG: hypothetical protein JWM47_3474 [Acidimicrobiales bacterium]|nr:hypothetical protein [Acidimicrobiales bacterium]
MNPTKHTALRRIIAASVLSATIATTAIAGSATVASAGGRPSGPSDITSETVHVIYKPSKFDKCRSVILAGYDHNWDDADWENLFEAIETGCGDLR